MNLLVCLDLDIEPKGHFSAQFAPPASIRVRVDQTSTETRRDPPSQSGSIP